MEKNEVKKNDGVNEKNIKLYSVLAYIGFLWIVGLCVKEKDNKTLRFHVGQGIIATICSIIISLFNNIVTYNIFSTTQYVFGVPYRAVTGFGRLIGGLLSLIPLALMIIGIVNAANNKEEELPIVGKYSFYK